MERPDTDKREKLDFYRFVTHILGGEHTLHRATQQNLGAEGEGATVGKHLFCAFCGKERVRRGKQV